jgi:hypothetical protein
MTSVNSFGIIVEARGEGKGEARLPKLPKMVIAGIGKREDERLIQPTRD